MVEGTDDFLTDGAVEAVFGWVEEGEDEDMAVAGEGEALECGDGR